MENPANAVLIDKLSFELLLEGQMIYQREEVQGWVFLAARFPFSPSDPWEYLILRSRLLCIYTSHISLPLLTKTEANILSGNSCLNFRF